MSLLLVSLTDCGARTRGNDPESGSKLDLEPGAARRVGPRTCTVDAECLPDACATYRCFEGFCVESTRVECPASADVCMKHECDPVSGSCEAVNATSDLDGDGYYAPRLGARPGEANSCGNDCDDSHADSNPYGEETCDGHDNDCDGLVDEGFEFLAPARDAVLISKDSNEASLGGLSHNGELFLLSYSRRRDRNESLLVGMRSAEDVDFTSDLVLTNSDTYAGPVRWTGESFVTAWEDRRHEDFEIYWNRFDASGAKLGPDLRLSQAPDFSLRPNIEPLGDGHVVFWQDRRDRWLDFQIYAQRIDERGELLGGNVNLTSDYVDSEAPSVALGDDALALVFNTPLDGRQVVFRKIGFDLNTVGEARVISRPNAVGASITYNAGNYVVLWHEYDVVPGDAIWGTVLDSSGAPLGEPLRATAAAEFARGHALRALGDRLLLLWTEYRDGAYELFFRTLAPDLSPLTETIQVTDSGGDVIGATMAIGGGALGIAYMSYESGAPQVYFTSLRCE